MKIIIGNDHAAVELKQAISAHLRSRGFEVRDVGCAAGEEADYPDIAKVVARAVIDKEYSFGILVCGTGIGMSMAANRYAGIRAAAVCEAFGAKYTRAHNDANVLCLGSRITGEGAALMLTDIFLDTPFDADNPRHKRRVEKIDKNNEGEQ